MTARAILAAAAVAALFSGWSAVAMKDDDTPAKSTEPRRVSVRLLGRAADITGVAVPAHILAGERPRFFQVDVPAVFAVDLLGSKTVTMPVKSASIVTDVDVRTKTAVVVDIELLPLPKAVSYREAVTEVRRLMRGMNIEPDERMQKQMAEWPDDSGHSHYRAGMWVSPKVGLGVEVKSALAGAWFVVFTFAIHADESRSLWDPNFKSTPKPLVDE